MRTGPERMQTKSEHLLPLPAQAMAVLQRIRPLAGHGELVLPRPFCQGRLLRRLQPGRAARPAREDEAWRGGRVASLRQGAGPLPSKAARPERIRRLGGSSEAKEAAGLGMPVPCRA